VMYIAAVHMCKEVYMRHMYDIDTGCDKLSVRLIDWCLAVFQLYHGIVECLNNNCLEYKLL
jgi:hypothetical protein